MRVPTACCRLLWRYQQYLPKRLSRSVYKAMSRRDQAPEHLFVADFYGVHYEGSLSNNIDFNVYYYGAYEKHVLHFLDATLKAIAPAGGVFVDIGANVGQHSLYMQRQASRVIAATCTSKARASSQA